MQCRLIRSPTDRQALLALKLLYRSLCSRSRDAIDRADVIASALQGLLHSSQFILSGLTPSKFSRAERQQSCERCTPGGSTATRHKPKNLAAASTLPLHATAPNPVLLLECYLPMPAMPTQELQPLDVANVYPG